MNIILESLFVTKEGWARLKVRLGFKPQCGCQQREGWLNTVGERIHQAVARLLQTALKGKDWLLRLAGR